MHFVSRESDSIYGATTSPGLRTPPRLRPNVRGAIWRPTELLGQARCVAGYCVSQVRPCGWICRTHSSILVAVVRQLLRYSHETEHDESAVGGLQIYGRWHTGWTLMRQYNRRSDRMYSSRCPPCYAAVLARASYRYFCQHEPCVAVQRAKRRSGL